MGFYETAGGIPTYKLDECRGKNFNIGEAFYLKVGSEKLLVEAVQNKNLSSIVNRCRKCIFANIRYCPKCTYKKDEGYISIHFDLKRTSKKNVKIEAYESAKVSKE